jgi:hypothetical protein
MTRDAKPDRLRCILHDDLERRTLQRSSPSLSMRHSCSPFLFSCHRIKPADYSPLALPTACFGLINAENLGSARVFNHPLARRSRATSRPVVIIYTTDNAISQDHRHFAFSFLKDFLGEA